MAYDDRIPYLSWMRAPVEPSSIGRPFGDTHGPLGCQTDRLNLGIDTYLRNLETDWVFENGFCGRDREALQYRNIKKSAGDARNASPENDQGKRSANKNKKEYQEYLS